MPSCLQTLPTQRRQRVQARAMELATFKDLRQAAQQTQAQLAVALGVGQDTISRLENRPPVVIEHLGVDSAVAPKATGKARRVALCPQTQSLTRLRL